MDPANLPAGPVGPDQNWVILAVSNIGREWTAHRATRGPPKWSENR